MVSRVVDHVELLQAPVAGAAVGALVSLAEILDQGPVTAARARGVFLHVAQQRARAFIPFAVGLEHLPPAHEVAAGIDQHALRRQPVASRASRLLLIVLRRPRRACMDDEPDVRAIDAHPERDGRDDDVDALVQEHLLVVAADFVRQAGVIRHRAVPLARQPLGQRFDLLPRRAVDDARLPVVPIENRDQLRVEMAAANHPVHEVRPIEGSDQLQRFAQPQLGEDVPAHALGGGRGEGVEGDAGKFVAQPAELPVFRTKVVPPLADAVGFVDRDELQVGLLEQAPQHRPAVADEPLGRDVEQAAASVPHARDDLVALVRQQRAVQERRRDAVDAQAVDLILHQRDERRHDQAQAIGRDRRRLKAQRLAAAGREDDDAVARGQDRVHRLALEGAEVGEAPDAVKRIPKKGS